MGELWPPSIPEWHASVVGFAAGVISGSDNGDTEIASTLVTHAVTDDGPHPSQARAEAAYTLTAYVLGLLVGRRID